LEDVKTAKLVHVDYHFGNLLYADQKIPGVFDFEWALAGDPLYDYCRWFQGEEEWPKSREPFLRGSGGRKLTAKQMDRVKTYQMIRNIELCLVAKRHFGKDEANSFRQITMAGLFQ